VRQLAALQASVLGHRDLADVQGLSSRFQRRLASVMPLAMGRSTRSTRSSTAIFCVDATKRDGIRVRVVRISDVPLARDVVEHNHAARSDKPQRGFVVSINGVHCVHRRPKHKPQLSRWHQSTPTMSCRRVRS